MCICLLQPQHGSLGLGSASVMYTECLWNLQNLLEPINELSKFNVEKSTVLLLLEMKNGKFYFLIQVVIHVCVWILTIFIILPKLILLGWAGISPWQPKSVPYPIKDVRISGWVGISDWQPEPKGNHQWWITALFQETNPSRGANQNFGI